MLYCRGTGLVLSVFLHVGMHHDQVEVGAGWQIEAYLPPPYLLAPTITSCLAPPHCGDFEQLEMLFAFLP